MTILHSVEMLKALFDKDIAPALNFLEITNKDITKRQNLEWVIPKNNDNNKIEIKNLEDLINFNKVKEDYFS